MNQVNLLPGQTAIREHRQALMASIPLKTGNTCIYQLGVLHALLWVLNGGEPPTSHLIRRCGMCGCTDNYRSHCMKRTGQPCRWIEPALCSACEEVKP